jgi:hypothetical protein
MRFYAVPVLLLMLAFCASPEAARGQWATNSNNADINNTNTGNVGIGTGTTAPGEKLVVTGGGLFGGALSRTSLWDTFSTGANPALLEINSGAAVSNSSRFAALSLVTKQAGTADAVGGIYFGNSNLTTAEKRVAAISSSTDGATNSGMLNFTTADGGALFERMRITSSGHVGIGVGIPVSKLTVADGNIHLQSTALVANGAMGDIGFGPGGGSFWGVGPRAFMRGYFQGTNWYSGTALSFFTHAGGDITANNNVEERMRIDKDGNVGIGTSSPAAKLHVTGNSIVTGNMDVAGVINGGTINAKYQDVAEWVESSQKLEAGTVVALDPGKSNQVLASAEAYDTKVAGVVSAQPGIALGIGGEGKVLVATTGRVKVKVDATRAPIKIGDLLVTSDVQGVAMRSEPITIGGRRMHTPGTLIGKALEPLAKGTGEILVLLSLQ